MFLRLSSLTQAKYMILKITRAPVSLAYYPLLEFTYILTRFTVLATVSCLTITAITSNKIHTRSTVLTWVVCTFIDVYDKECSFVVNHS